MQYIEIVKDITPPLPHVDLMQLRNHDDMEADIFENIMHIQTHRRTRALQRLTVALPKCTLSVATLRHILMPMVEHFIYETNPRENQGMANEASAALGALSSQLSWTHYFALFSTLLKQLNRYPLQEPTIISSLVAMIDAFHFNVPLVPSGWIKPATGDVSACVEAENPIQIAIRNKLIPMLQSHLTKAYDEKGKEVKIDDDEKIQSGGQILRIPIAVALVKLLRRLPAEKFHGQLPKLIIAIVKLLKSMVVTEQWKPIVLSESSSATDGEDESGNYNPLKWIFTRLSFTARDPHPLRQMTVFKYFAAMASKNPTWIHHFLIAILNPLYRVQQEETVVEGVKDFGAQVLLLLENTVGASAYLQAYTHVQSRVSAFRAKRKAGRQVEAVADPQRFAERKVRKLEVKKRAIRKRIVRQQQWKGRAPKSQHG